MRSVQLHGIRDVRIHGEDKPSPRPGECLVEVKAVTICGSDLHIYAEGNVGGVGWDRPFIPCHEFAGICHGGQHIPEGAKVVADPALPCQRCDMCLRGWRHLCRNLVFCGLPPCEGALREFIAWPEHALFPCPDFLSFGEMALVESLAVAVHAVELAPPPPGGRVAILGCGGIGLSVLQVARAAGASELLATDLVPERLDIAHRLGADVAVLADKEDPIAVAEDWSHGDGVDVVYEAAGAPDTPAQAVEMARPKGTVALLGIPVEDVMTVRASRARRHELTIVWVRRQNHNYPKAIALVEKGLVSLKPLLTHCFPAEQADAAFALAETRKEGAVRVGIEF